MITHEIRKSRGIVPFVHQHAVPMFRRTMDAILGTKDNDYVYTYQMGQKYMEKISYARWLETDVRPKFPKNSLVTMKNQPFVVGHAPRPLFVVSDLQEIAFMAPVSVDYNEPKCVFLRDYRHGISMQLAYAPSCLRLLNEEELKIVNTRDKANEATQIGAESLDSSPQD